MNLLPKAPGRSAGPSGRVSTISRPQRLGLAVVLVGALAAGAIYDFVDRPSPQAVAAVSNPANVNPSLSSPPRLNGAWYCPVGSSTADGLADHVVNIANFGSETAVASVSVITEEGPGPRDRIELAPFSTQRVSMANIQESEAAGAIVEIVGGDGSVSHSVTTEHGVAEGPCATHASSTWHFASGRTYFDAEQYLVLMNPFPETAVFDLTFRTPGSPVAKEPGPLDAAVVDARSVKVVRVNDFVSGEQTLAATVTTERGRLVVERLQLLTGDPGPAGASLQLGVPSPAPSWMFTGGRLRQDGDDRLFIYNPESAESDIASEELNGSTDDEPDEPETGEPETDELGNDSTEDDSGEDEEGDGLSSVVDDVVLPGDDGATTVSVQLWPLNPTDLSTYSVVTIQREVWAGYSAEIDLRSEAARFDFPLPYELGINVTSDNGRPVVVERWQYGKPVVDDAVDAVLETDEGEATEDGDPLVGDAGLDLQAPGPVDLLPQPEAVDGVGTSRGNEQFAQRWVLPWVTTTADSTLVALAALEETSAEIRLLNTGGLSEPTTTLIPAGGRAVVPIEALGGGTAVQVSADAPISVEAVVVLPAGGLDVIPAIPVVVG